MSESLPRRLEELCETWCGDLEVKFEIQDSSATRLSIDTRATYSLLTSTSEEKTTGSQSHDCNSRSECVSKIERYCRMTKAGENAGANAVLVEMIQADPVGTLSTTAVIESIKHAYVETCNNCGGKGSTSCTACQGRGDKPCTCTGGRTRCAACGGTGRHVDSMNRTTRCTGCGGAGNCLCTVCGGSSRVRCGVCGGSGSRSCSTCSGTGYFTHVITATTSLVAEQTCLWDADAQEAWINEYITRALDGTVPQAPINETVDWDLGTFDLTATGSLPYHAEMEGVLEGEFARVSVAPDRVAACYFIGSQHIPYAMDELFDPVIEQHVAALEDDYSHEGARRLFNSALAITSFEKLNSSERPENLVSWAGLISEKTCNSLKQSLLHVGQMFDAMRGEIRLRDPGVWTAVCFFLGMLAIYLVSGFVNHDLPWDQMGVRAVIAGSDAAVVWLWHESLRGPDSVLIPYMVATFLPAMAFMYVFGTTQVWSLARMLAWYWGFSLALGLIITGLQPALELFRSGKLVFSLDAFHWPTVDWRITIDVLLVSLLLGLLRARRQAFNMAREEAAQVGSQALNILLGYETKE